MTRIESTGYPPGFDLLTQAGPPPAASGSSPEPGIPQDVWEVATQAKQSTERATAEAKGQKKKGKSPPIRAPFKGVAPGTEVPSSVPGASFRVSRRGFPVGTAREVNGMVEVPGIGWVKAPTRSGRKGAVNLKTGKRRLLTITRYKDGTIAVKEKKLKSGGFFSSTVGKVLGGVLAVASFVFPVLAPVAIAYNVASSAYAMSQGNYLGGALQLAGSAVGLGGLGGALGQVASTVGKVATGINAGQAAYNGIKNGDWAGAAAGLAGAAATGANLAGLPAGTTQAINNAARVVQGGATVANGIKSGDFSTIGAGLAQTANAVNTLTPLPKEVLAASNLARNIGTVVDGIRGRSLGEIGGGLAGAAKTLGVDKTIKDTFGIG